MEPSRQSLLTSARSFAEGLVREGLQRPTTVETWRDLLKRLAAQGWLSPPGVAGYPEAGAILEGLAVGGADLGVPLTLTVHYLLTLKVLRRHANDLIPQISQGTGLACMAASEPKVGSHPGKISTRAVRSENGWTLNGLKVFTTGGPIGTAFLVLAVCAESPEGRDLGVFLVPRESAGLSVKEMPVHPGLESALHGVLEFKNVRLPLSARVGPSGPKENGWTKIVKPFRQWEDALLQSWVAGLAQRHAAELARSAGKSAGNSQNSNGPPSGGTAAPAALLLGRLAALSRGLATLARDSAQSLADEEAGASGTDLTARRYAFYEALGQLRPFTEELAACGAAAGDHPALAGLRALLVQLEFAKNSRVKIIQGLAKA